MRAADSLSGDLGRWLLEHELTASQFAVLEVLLHLGPLHQIIISEKLLKTSGNITMVLSHLERRGLIARDRDDNDRRCNTVRLTSSGRRLISSLSPQHATHITELFGILSPEQQEALGSLCRQLGQNVRGK